MRKLIIITLFGLVNFEVFAQQGGKGRDYLCSWQGKKKFMHSIYISFTTRRA